MPGVYSSFLLPSLFRLSPLDAELSFKQVYQHRQDDTKDDGCRQGEVEGEVLLFYKDVAGQAAQPWDFRRNEQEQADGGDDEPEYDEKFTERGHGKIKV